MLTLHLPFRLGASAPPVFRRSLGATREEEPTEIVLEGLSISIWTGTRVYEVSSNHSPADDGPSGGTAWVRWLWPVADGIALEQQIAMPRDGNAFAISWRSVGRPPLSWRLQVRPIFRAAEPFARIDFRFEPERKGGRLVWQPFLHSSKVIADTNGGFEPAGSLPGARIVPASFEFNLSPQPAVLIFSCESSGEGAIDPLIGGFLARLSAAPSATAQDSPLRDLVAA